MYRIETERGDIFDVNMMIAMEATVRGSATENELVFAFNEAVASFEIEKYLKRNPNTSYVAVLDGKVVGVILCGHDGRRGIVQHACVSPDCRRMGIGKKLVDLALDALKKEGINKVLLVAFKKNEGGNAFWESQGFTIREDLNYRNKALTELIRIDPDYL